MNELEIKNKSNFGKDFDLSSQEIEKTNFFLIESELKDFNELVYLCYSINKKYTALLYREKDHSYLYLFILKHIIDKTKENISYKIKTKLKFNKSEIDKTNLDDKQMFLDDQANKNTYNEYSITLINKDLILLQVIGKKIMIVNFEKKEYTILFCNSSDKKSIQVVSTYDELIVTKKENDEKKYQIRTYIFCVSSGKLYFFMVNDKVFSDFQFLLIPFPFTEEITDCIDFEILKINNKREYENCDIFENKYYFVFIVLLNGKFIRYVTNWVNCGLKDILLNFQTDLEKNLIKRSLDFFDKGNNNCGLKVYRSEKCASFIILQIGFHIFSFKYYETDTPEEIMQRFGIKDKIEKDIDNNNKFDKNNKNLEVGDSIANIENNHFNINLNSNVKNEGEISDSNSLKHSGKNTNILFNTLNDSLSISKMSLFQQKARHGSLANINYPKFSSSKNSPKINRINNMNTSINNMQNIESMVNNTHMNSLDHTESNITFNDIKDNIKDSNITKNISSEVKNSSIPEFKTKDKGVVYYSLEKFYDLNLNNENENIENEENLINSKENIIEENSKMNESYISQSKNIIYSFTYHSFLSFIQTTNNVIISHNPDKINENEGQIEKIMKFNNKLSLNYDKIEILDVLHYYSLKYSYLLTNKYIFKFRVNTDLFHLFNILNKHKNNSIQNDKKKDSIFYKLKSIFRYSRSNKIPEGGKCKLCKKRDSQIICQKCKRAIYCCVDHMNDDYRNIHFFQCEMNICIEKLEKNKKKSENLAEINNVIISFKNILNQIFIFVENKKDYMNYTVFLKIMLNILFYIDIEGCMNKALSPMRTKISNDFRKVCDKIFIIELWFFYCNLNILYITFIVKSGNFFLATHLLHLVKVVDLIEKKDVKLTSMFAYFSLANDLTKYKMNNKKDIKEYTKKFFFNLLKIYTNENKNSNYLYIHEQFFIYYLHTFSSLLKIHLFLKEKTKTMKEIGAINIDKIVCYLPKLFEEKLNNIETSDVSQYPNKLPLIIIYYYLSFILVKIDKVSHAITLLRYILGEISRINNYKDNKTNEPNKITYSTLEAKIYLNIGILMNYNGDFNLGIHHLENCYRLCFQEKLSSYLTMKVLDMLCLAYINNDKVDTAFILVKKAISLKKKFLSEKKNKFNSTILIYKLNLFKLKIYLLFIYQYISYKYQKMNNFLNTKSIKGKNKIIKNPDDIPSSITPIAFNKISPGLIGYVCEEDKKKKKAELLKDKINKDDEYFKFELDSNLDKFALFCYSGKLEMIIKALEFLYKLSEKEYEILNNDNGSTQKEDNKDDNYNLRERSSSVSRDFSISYSKPVGVYKDKINFFFKEDNETFLDEIEVKIGLYDQLSDAQQKELKTIQNNVFRRSILLRDPKGKIDKFNLNYHPKYTLEFCELFSKLNETVFLNQLEKFGIGEQYEAKLFEHKNDGLIYSLRKYLNLEKIQNILYIQKVKLFEKYKQKLILVQKTEYKETITKNQSVANDYINKIKEKFSKDKFLKNMNLDGLYEKLVNELTNKELNYILENPNKILNYIYINTKTFPDFFLYKTEKILNKDDESRKTSEDNSGESKSSSNKVSVRSSKKIKKKEISVQKQEDKNENKEDDKKSILSPRTIYNSLIDLISEKRSERSGNKKRTVNFKSVKISKILDYVESKEKNQIDSKRTKKLPNKKWYRSQSLNKNNYYRQTSTIKRTTKKQGSKFRFISNFANNQNNNNDNANNKNFDLKIKQNNNKNQIIQKRNSAFNVETNNNLNNIIERKTNIIDKNNIKAPLENLDINDKKNNLRNNKDNVADSNLNKSIVSTKNNNHRKKYERKPTKNQTFVFEENISQVRNEINANTDNNSKNNNNKLNNPIYKKSIINNNEILSKRNDDTNKNNIKNVKKEEKEDEINIKYTIKPKKKKVIKRSSVSFHKNNSISNTTCISNKIKNMSNVKNKNEKNIEYNIIKDKNETIDNKLNENKINNIFGEEKEKKNEENKNKTIVQRKKPSFKELREKVLHRNNTSFSAFI